MRKLLVASAFALVGALSLTTAASAQWVDGKGSCQATCAAQGTSAVSSGKFTNGKPYNICAANVKNDGFRAGYNLEPNWVDGCVVGWGGKEEKIAAFKCLCQIGAAGK